MKKLLTFVIVIMISCAVTLSLLEGIMSTIKLEGLRLDRKNDTVYTAVLSTAKATNGEIE